MQRTIFHVDLDAFFAAVERVVNPDLIGKPLIVGGIGNRGVVTCASYEAREFGVHAAMPIAIARRLCPQGVFVPTSHDLYGSFSKRFMAILRDHSPVVQTVSVDEAFIDMTGTEKLFGMPLDAAENIRARVHGDLKVTASIGIAPSKLVAKIASDAAKPDGVRLVAPGDEAAFLAPMPARKLPGLGPKAEEALALLGIKTIGDLAGHSLGPLRRALGPNNAESLQRRAMGIDHSEVTTDGEAKSISAETTFNDDSDDLDYLNGRLQQLAERVGARLRKSEKFARTVTLKLRYYDFETITRQTTLPVAGDGDGAISAAGKELLDKAMAHRRAKVRLVGVGVGNLTERVGQLSLLDTDPISLAREDSALSGTVDAIRERFGNAAINRGRT
ncbi:MAG: DNA polymerase IV [Chloroflexi bacterium]|nr:DNA polymerase IV [Chloroflexota bacterium]